MDFLYWGRQCLTKDNLPLTKYSRDEYLISTIFLLVIKPQYSYPNNGNGLYVMFQRMREGPSHFLVMYKKQSKLVRTVNEMKKVLGQAKFLDSSKELYEWMEEQIKQNTKPKETGNTGIRETIKKEGFGPEAHEEPNDNTKMVT